MARRKKEPRTVHRRNIAMAAGKLFEENGTENTSMDDIAKAAGYSKATLYVYFQNKEEIVSVLAMESMQKLYDCISSALKNENSTKKRYDLICQGLVEYQEEFPYYFKVVLGSINIDFNEDACPPEDRETFQIGEAINTRMEQFLKEGITKGELRDNIAIKPTIFSFWGMLSGLIQLAESKEKYILLEMKMSKQEFLQQGFDTLYKSVEKE